MSVDDAPPSVGCSAIPMKVLVLNAGSTSVKYNLYDMDTDEAFHERS